MPFRRSLLLSAAIAACGLAGCSVMDPWAGFWHDFKRLAKPQATDRHDPTEASQEEWEFVGQEGRRGQEVEKDPDQWFRKYIMSEKARSIEENLGFE